VFDEFYNQRVINLSKFLARQGCGVIYVAWRWSKDDPMPDIGREVFSNIFQVPVDMLLENLTELGNVQHPHKYFVAEFPHPNFLTAALELRRYGFPVIYEVIDEWEEFHKMGQAPWFDGDIERAMIVNANLLVAVSPPLVKKFSDLRSDIHLLPNGYDPSILGRNSRNIAQHHFERSETHAGYFGHLTDSWFDWDLLLRVLDLAKDQEVDLHFHIIGYGGPSQEEKLANYRDRLTLHGKVKPADLRRYVQEWDIAMIPFHSGKLSEAVDPLKIYEYLYFGLPVIVTGITHLARLPRVRVARDAGEFLEALSAFKEEAHGQQDSTEKNVHQAVVRLLEESTWEQRFSRLLSLLEAEQWMPL
jgi:glycosyltransferase involved in cell wall biosynthesis